MQAAVGQAAPQVLQRRPAVGANRAGVVVGLLVGGWHLLWSALVATGAAQPLIDFIFWLHFIRPVYVIEPFDPLRAVLLVVLTGVLGYAVGGAFGLLWNRFRH